MVVLKYELAACFLISVQECAYRLHALLPDHEQTYECNALHSKEVLLASPQSRIHSPWRLNKGFSEVPGLKQALQNKNDGSPVRKDLNFSSNQYS